jgi:hypothetical protein
MTPQTRDRVAALGCLTLWVAIIVAINAAIIITVQRLIP